jgi:hypothetical protein
LLRALVMSFRGLALLLTLLSCDSGNPAVRPPDAAPGGDASPDGSGPPIGPAPASCAPASQPCQPLGIWRVRYEQRALVSEERVEVRRDDAGRLMVTFPGRQVPNNMCTPTPTPGTFTTVGEVSADGCTLTVGRRESYCFSGEGQCSELDATLVLCGDGSVAKGPGSTCRCWDPGFTCERRPIEVTATREKP